MTKDKSGKNDNDISSSVTTKREFFLSRPEAAHDLKLLIDKFEGALSRGEFLFSVPFEEMLTLHDEVSQSFVVESFSSIITQAGWTYRGIEPTPNAKTPHFTVRFS